MGINTQLPPPIEQTDLITEYRPYVGGDGFTSLASDIPIVGVSSGTGSQPPPELFESDSWWVHTTNVPNDNLSQNGATFTVGGGSGARVYLTPKPSPPNPSLKPPTLSAPFLFSQVKDLVHLSHDGIIPGRSNPAASVSINGGFEDSSFGTVDISGAIDLIPGQNPAEAVGGVSFILADSENLNLTFSVQYVHFEAQHYVVNGNDRTPINVTDHLIEYGISDREFIINGTVFATIPFGSRFGIMILLAGSTASPVEKTWVIGDYTYARNAPPYSPADPVVLRPCLPSTNVNGNSATYSTPAAQEGERAVFRTAQFQFSSGLYALLFNVDSGESPIVKYYDMFGELAHISQGRDIFDGIQQGFYFNTSRELSSTLNFITRDADRAYSYGHLEFIFPENRSGAISQIRLVQIWEHLTRHRWPTHRSPKMLPFHESPEYHWIFHTGDVVDISPLRTGESFLPTEPDFPSGLGGLEYEPETGRVTGEVKNIFNFVVLGHRIKSVSRFHYDLSPLRSRENIVYNRMIFTPGTPDTDGSLGNFLPSYTDGEEVFTVSVHSGTLPIGIELDPDTGRIFHSGANVFQGTQSEDVSFAVTTANGTCVSPTYTLFQNPPVSPDFDYDAYSNAGLTSGQYFPDRWHLSLGFPVDEIPVSFLIGDYDQAARWDVTGGNLPPGFQIRESDGTIFGDFLPDQSPVSGSVTIQLENYQGSKRERTFGWSISGQSTSGVRVSFQGYTFDVELDASGTGTVDGPQIGDVICGVTLQAPTEITITEGTGALQHTFKLTSIVPPQSVPPTAGPTQVSSATQSATANPEQYLIGFSRGNHFSGGPLCQNQPLTIEVL